MECEWDENETYKMYLKKGIDNSDISKTIAIVEK